jgi:CBS domain containing-hemolysin-like protein
LALIEDDGRIVGLMTITDAFEVIAGEVRDPLDRVHSRLPT